MLASPFDSDKWTRRYRLCRWNDAATFLGGPGLGRRAGPPSIKSSVSATCRRPRGRLQLGVWTTSFETESTRVLDCEECGCDSDDDAHGWTGHLAREEDDSITVAVFCPVCSDEF